MMTKNVFPKGHVNIMVEGREISFIVLNAVAMAIVIIAEKSEIDVAHICAANIVVVVLVATAIVVL